MRILIDADACPIPAKEILFRVSERLKIPLILVANSSMRIPSSPLISLTVVPQGADVADDVLVELARPDDLVITADIPLAARVIRKCLTAEVLDPRGNSLTDANIGSRLAVRDLMDSLRNEGLSTGGPAPYSAKDKQAFANQLDKFLTRVRPKPVVKRSFHDQDAVTAFLESQVAGKLAWITLRDALYREGRRWGEALGFLAAPLAAEVDRRFAWRTLELLATETADDGSLKALWEAPDGKRLESVLIRSTSGRATLCVSTQVGCAMGCTFCSTGQLGLTRNLSGAEILEQASWAVEQQRILGQTLRNVVYMGMGEPLLNVDALRMSLEGLMDQRRFKIAPRHISVSTCGVVGAIEAFGREFPLIKLAVSLHAARQDLRDELMPGCRGWTLARLLPELDAWSATTGHKLFFEYVMIAGVNDGPRERAELVNLLTGRKGHVNLIPYNPGPGDLRRPSHRETLDAFQRDLKAAGIPSTVRHSAGAAIAAACGQLAGSTSLKS